MLQVQAHRDSTLVAVTNRGVVDLRSDTLTHPTEAMRQAMASAPVGDDRYGEDPTVNRLEERFAQLVGKPAAVYVPSGTMGNQIALRLHGTAGSNVVVGRRQHLMSYESGAAGLNNAFQIYAVDDASGVVDTEAAAEAVAAGNGGFWPPVSLICLENTHLSSGGLAIGSDELSRAAALGPPVHLDGARLFNAAVALGTTAEDLAATATTVMSCVSKGLGAPVGSLLAGPADLITEARLHRRRLGGAMRQAGVIAAGGLYALEHHIDRLADDHARAQRLGDVVAERWPGTRLGEAEVACGRPLTNVVAFRHSDYLGLLDHLRNEGIRAGLLAPGIVRFVTHLDVDDADIDRAVAALSSAPG
ncbi:MAG: low specificity L-threonine aldolase [Acidimicrobiia bacterium]|nr:low specificity L-threonine aldolase [Acidimicrobiia bacterium]MYJ32670.1 low specificity L-threonine aldolase [Acidimicrobiia bacterium]